MGIIRRLMGEEPRGSGPEFVDLTEYSVEATAAQPASCLVKVAEVTRTEDVADLADEVYAGHILLVDVKALAKDEFQYRRVSAELKRIAADVGGDVAGVAEDFLCVTPRGIKVERQKIRVAA